MMSRASKSMVEWCNVMNGAELELYIKEGRGQPGSVSELLLQLNILHSRLKNLKHCTITAVVVRTM